jgi:hypothetical protein
MNSPVFDVDRRFVAVLKYPLFVKGVGLPADGVCVAADNEEIIVEQTASGGLFYDTHYRRRPIRVAIGRASLKSVRAAA